MASYYKNAKVDLTTTGITTLYTAAAGSTAIFNSILTDSSSAVFIIFDVKATVANATVELLTRSLVVQESEILKVTAGNANRLHVVASYLEIS